MFIPLLNMPFFPIATLPYASSSIRNVSGADLYSKTQYLCSHTVLEPTFSMNQQSVGTNKQMIVDR
jgi:hypothetical protein